MRALGMALMLLRGFHHASTPRSHIHGNTGVVHYHICDILRKAKRILDVMYHQYSIIAHFAIYSRNITNMHGWTTLDTSYMGHGQEKGTLG